MASESQITSSSVREPWPALHRSHRAQARIGREVERSRACVRGLVRASGGLWCTVAKQELALLGEQFLRLVEQVDAQSPSQALRVLADLLDVADAALGTVGILDDWMPLETALDAADAAYRDLGEALDDRVVRLTDRIGPAAPSVRRAVIQSR